jgi:hypothetical protein
VSWLAAAASIIVAFTVDSAVVACSALMPLLPITSVARSFQKPATMVPVVMS